ncbi:hypothetical protein BsWGS_18069 [Bradybaena similaris]
MFTGVLYSFDESLGKLVLKRVTTSGSKLCGLQNFYFSDMIKLQVVNEPPRSTVKRTPLTNNNNGNNFMSIDPNVSTPPLVMEAKTISVDESAMANINGAENGETRWMNEEHGMVDEYHDSSLLNVNDEYYEKDYYTLIYRLGAKFYEAIDYIMKQEAVGVTFEGESIGRNGILSVVQISTETDVIAFDILELGKEAFAEGLHTIFQSNNIVKVIHDCRWISDMLHEQYKIRITNVFDTQVANACVYRILHNGNWPQYVESLPACLVKHLKLQPEDVTFFRVKDGVQQTSGQPSWLERPLSKQLLSAAQKNVSYLTQLHQVLLKKMMYEFRMGVEIYLSHVRNMDGDFESSQKQGYLLPPIFWKIPKLVYLTCDDSKSQNGFKKDLQGKDLPAPERGFLSHNSVRPRPKESVVGSRESNLQENNVGRYAYEGNAYAVLNQKMDRRYWRTDTPEAYDSHVNNSNVENGTIKHHKKAQQSNNLHPQEEITCGSHQLLSVPSSLQRSYVRNKTVSQKEPNTKIGEFNASSGSLSDLKHKYNNENSTASRHEQDQHKALSQKGSNAEIREFHENDNKLTFSVVTGDSNKQNSSVQEPDRLMASSEKSLFTHTNVMPGKHKDVLPLENPSPASGVSAVIRQSKLWQMFNANQNRGTTELSRHSTDVDSHSDIQEVLMKSDAEQDILIETTAENGRRAMPKLVRMESKSESSDYDDMPAKSDSVDLLCTSHLSASFHNNDSENSQANHSSAELNISRGKDLDCSSFLPAGFGEVRTKKKKAADQKQSHKSTNKHESDNKEFLPTSLNEEDLCYIPMQSSLKYRQELPLGVSPCDYGDPFSDSECNLQPLGNSQFCLDSCQGFDTESFSDNESICNFQQSEMFQKVLKMASSLPLENLKNKLLPSKVSLCGK